MSEEEKIEKNIIYGRNTILEALNSEAKVNKIWHDANFSPKIIDILELARTKKIPVMQVQKQKLYDLAGTNEHRSIVAELSPIEFIEEKDFLKHDFKKILIAVNVQDPHNLGAIIRSAYAFGIDAVCYTARNSAQLNNTVLTSSAGAALKTNLVRINNVTNFIKTLKDNKYWVYASVVEPESSESLNNIKFDDMSAILVGNEGKGLSDKIVKHCDFTVHIPVRFNSLNVSVATAIICNKIYNN
jgi:23S rRNA (guanosine2251-2'-O)-methyltransferase